MGASGQHFTMGTLYASVWWEIRKRVIADNSALERSYDELYMKHLALVRGADNFSTILNKIKTIDQAEYNSAFSAYFDAEYNRRGIDIPGPPAAAVTFSSLIGNGGVLANNCMGCHSGGTPAGNLDITDYASVSARVVPFAPDSAQSLLSQRMADANAPMPPAGLLPAADLNRVRDWIAQGAQNN
jgi:mono/diheme cytochrome c family protein